MFKIKIFQDDLKFSRWQFCLECSSSGVTKLDRTMPIFFKSLRNFSFCNSLLIHKGHDPWHTLYNLTYRSKHLRLFQSRHGENALIEAVTYRRYDIARTLASRHGKNILITTCYADYIQNRGFQLFQLPDHIGTNSDFWRSMQHKIFV